MTVDEAKQVLRDNWEDGIDCPCCDRLVKVYKRSLNAGMAFVLIHMYKMTNRDKPDGGWIKVQEKFARELGINATAMTYSILKWWGLIAARQGNEDPTKKGTGYWRITDKGKSFVEAKVRVPTQVHIYDNRCVGWSGDSLDVHEALQKKFDYQELMQPVARGQYL